MAVSCMGLNSAGPALTVSYRLSSFSTSAFILHHSGEDGMMLIATAKPNQDKQLATKHSIH